MEANLYVMQNTDDNKSFVWHKQLTVIEKDHLGDWSPEKDCC